MILKLVMKHLGMELYKVYISHNPGMTLALSCQIFRVTEEAIVAETVVWPIPLLINMLTAVFV